MKGADVANEDWSPFDLSREIVPDEINVGNALNNSGHTLMSMMGAIAQAVKDARERDDPPDSIISMAWSLRDLAVLGMALNVTAKALAGFQRVYIDLLRTTADSRDSLERAPEGHPKEMWKDVLKGLGYDDDEGPP